MAHALRNDWHAAAQDDLLVGLRQTRVYREASQRERQDLENFIVELRRQPPTALDLRQTARGAP